MKSYRGIYYDLSESIYSFEYDNLNREITDEEYNMVVHYACDLGVENAFIQTGGTASESFIPKFDCENIIGLTVKS